MQLKSKLLFLLLPFVLLITGCCNSDKGLSRSNRTEHSISMYTSTNVECDNNDTSECFTLETYEIADSGSIQNDKGDTSEFVNIDSSKFFCRNWCLGIDDYLVNQYAPIQQTDSGLYKVEGAAVIGIPQDYYIDGGIPDFALSVANAETLLNSWKIVFTGDELGNLSVKSADMYFEKNDESYSMYSERISFDGFTQLHGKLYCELSTYSNNPNLSCGDLVFYPYPQDIISTEFCIIPFSTSIRNNDGYIFAMDTVSLYLGNVDDYQNIQCDSFSNGNYLDISLTLKDINLFFAQAQSGESRSTAVIAETT